MAIIQLPIRNDIPAYTQVTQIEGQAYIFSFRFNSRSNRWYMDLLDEASNALIEGIKLLTDSDLNTRFKSDSLPPGMFLSVDESGRGQQPDRLNFSNDVILLYVDEESLANLQASV